MQFRKVFFQEGKRAWLALLFALSSLLLQYKSEQPNVVLKVKHIWKIPWTFTSFETKKVEEFTTFIFYVQMINTGGTPIALENFNFSVLQKKKYEDLNYLVETDSFIKDNLNVFFDNGLDNLMLKRIEKFSSLEVGETKSGFYLAIAKDFTYASQFTKAVRISCSDKARRKYKFETDLTLMANYLPPEEVERQTGVVFKKDSIKHVERY